MTAELIALICACFGFGVGVQLLATLARRGQP